MSGPILEQALERHGIRTLVFLRERNESLERERELADALGVRFVRVSMDDPQPAAKRFLRVMDDPDNHPVLIHCHYGVARTGLLAAVYRMEYDGWDGERAVGEARRYSGFDGFDEDSNKRRFLEAYEPRSSSGPRPHVSDPDATR